MRTIPFLPSLFTFVSGLALLGCSSDDSAGSGKPATDSAYPAAAEKCFNAINTYRATLNLTPYTRAVDDEPCADSAAKSDSISGTAHGAFGMCGESAQNECPGWGGTPDSMIDGCLQMMWDEGPGADFDTHGHYINMSSTTYTTVACGFFVTPAGDVWSVQNFH